MTINFLFNIEQQEGESLKKYMARNRATSVKVEDSEPRACAQVFKNGLRPGLLNNKLSRKPAESMVEIRARAHTYILDEEDDTFKRKRARTVKEGVSLKQFGRDKFGGEKGEGRKRKEKRAPVLI